MLSPKDRKVFEHVAAGIHEGDDGTGKRLAEHEGGRHRQQSNRIDADAPGNKVSGSGGNGVVVTAVNAGGIAAEHGFQVGDVILEVGGKAVTTPADVRKSLADARSEGKHTVLFRVKSNEGTKFVALPLGNA